MAYDPDKHHRRSIRLVLGRIEPGQPAVGWIKRSGSTMDLTTGIVVDPSASGRLDPPYWLFGHVVNGEMRLNDASEIARRCWEDIPDHFPLVELDAFVVMPNHVHGIIVIHGRGEASDLGRSLNTRKTADASPLQPYSP